MTDFTSEQLNQMKQAYYESKNLAIANANKYKNYTDPILQQNDYYVRNIKYNFNQKKNLKILARTAT